MPKDYSRSERLSSLIQRQLAVLIQGSMKDPRLSSASILEVQVSRDLAHAKVFFSVLLPEQAESCMRAFEHASGYLQREIGRAISTRVVPRLTFFYDDTDIRGREMSDLIDCAIATDRRKSGRQPE